MIKKTLIILDLGNNFNTKKSHEKKNVDETLRISMDKNVLQSAQKAN